MRVLQPGKFCPIRDGVGEVCLLAGVHRPSDTAAGLAALDIQTHKQVDKAMTAGIDIQRGKRDNDVEGLEEEWQRVRQEG